MGLLDKAFGIAVKAGKGPGGKALLGRLAKGFLVNNAVGWGFGFLEYWKSVNRDLTQVEKIFKAARGASLEARQAASNALASRKEAGMIAKAKSINIHHTIQSKQADSEQEMRRLIKRRLERR